MRSALADNARTPWVEILRQNGNEEDSPPREEGYLKMKPDQKKGTP